MRVFTPEETAEWFAGLEKRMSNSAIAIYDDQDRILIVKANYLHHWSFPGGIIDEGETPKQAALRETKEEVSISLSEDDVTFCHIIDHASPFTHTYQFVFEAKVSEIGEVVLDEDEIEAYEIVTRQQILDGDREYSDSALLWAQGFSGYIEREFFTLEEIDE